MRDPAVCASCHTKDCIRGSDEVPGCELHLYQPRKSSNMDCTFCLDCIHACPHDNVGILAETPGKALWHDSLRSGVGRFSKRTDLAALIVVLAFGAFVNAAGMVAPVLEWRDEMASLLRQRSPLLVTSLFYVFGLLVLPVSLVGTSAAICRWSRPAQGLSGRGGYSLLVRAGSHRIQHVASALQFSLLGELRRGNPCAPAVCLRFWLDPSRATDRGTRLLSACRGLASSAGDPVSRFRVVALAVFGLSDRTLSV